MILGFKKKKTISKHVGLTSELGFVHWPNKACHKIKVFSTLLPALLAFDKTFEVFEERNILLVL